MSKKRKIIIALGTLLAGVIVGVLIIGAVAYRLYSSSTRDREIVFAQTEVGTPVGDKVTKNIGPAGGTLGSPDGRLTLTVPANALSETVAFSIQPITNKAKAGVGLAYRLGPDGKTFTSPLDISVRYSDEDLEDTVPLALSLAFQDGQGAWHLNAAKLDPSAKTLTVAATHFTDWSMLKQLHIQPAKATLRVGETLNLEIIGCLPDEPAGWFPGLNPPPGTTCTVTDGRYKYPLTVDWHVDEGTIDDPHQLRILYTAPSKKPIPNVATLVYPYSVFGLDTDGRGGPRRGLLTAHITIVDRGYRASGKDGPVTYSGVICSLEEPFTITANNSLVPYPLNYVPSSPTVGKFSYTSTWKMLSMAGGGTYTIVGSDSEKLQIVSQVSSTLTGPGASSSGGGIAHIDLTPLDTDECKKP